jgi:hypothetical protein
MSGSRISRRLLFEITPARDHRDYIIASSFSHEALICFTDSPAWNLIVRQLIGWRIAKKRSLSDQASITVPVHYSPRRVMLYFSSQALLNLEWEDWDFNTDGFTISQLVQVVPAAVAVG